MQTAPGGNASSLTAGLRLDRYELLTEISRGASTSIWAARLRSAHGIEKLVAIKAIGGALAAEASFRDAFFDEVKKASAITHPNVAQVLDLGDRGDLLYVVSEYADGDSLWDLRAAVEAKRQKIPPAIVLRVLADVCAGLHAAHLLRDRSGKLLNVVHGDVCAQSILVSTSGVAKVIDFGLGKARARLHGAPNGKLLQGGEMPAPPPNQRLDRHADIWAVGAILHQYLAHLIVGVRGPRDGADDTARAPSVPGAVAELVHRALVTDPAQRFATAAEMQGAIEAAMVGLGIPTTTANVAAFAAEHLSDRVAARGQSIEDAITALPQIELPRPAIDADSMGGLAHSASTALAARAYPPPPSLLDDPTGSSLVPHIPPSPALYSTPPFGAMSTAPPGGLRSNLVAISAVAATAVIAVAAVVVIGVRSGRRAPDDGAAGNAAGAGALVAATPAAPKPKCPASMVEIQGGKFFMGSDDDLDLEKPAHHVTLSPFCMDTLEVSTEQYKACSDSGDCKRAAVENKWDGISARESKVYDPLCNIREPMARGKHPINCIDWQMAARYCEAQGGRLPTEAEWEFAARGPDGRKYPWGDEEPSPLDLNACGKECLAWGKKNKVDLESMYDGDDGWPTTAPVGSFPAGKSRYGVQDVMGNVWEWTADYFAPYSAEALVDPKGPPSGEARVIRGGAWNGAYPAWVRPTFRYKNAPDTRSYGVGFRCARSIR